MEQSIACNWIGFPRYQILPFDDQQSYGAREIIAPKPQLQFTQNIFNLCKSEIASTTEACDSAEESSWVPFSDNEEYKAEPHNESDRTHFVAFKIDDPTFIEACGQFQKNILNSEFFALPKPAVKKMLTKISQLHMTICLLSLETELKLSKAKEIFASVKEKINRITHKSHLNLKFQGLDTMAELGENSSLIVTKPQVNTNTKYQLDSIVSEIILGFLNHRLLKKEDLIAQRLCDSDLRTIKVNHHVTLLNTKFLLDGSHQVKKLKLNMTPVLNTLDNDFRASASIKTIEIVTRKSRIIVDSIKLD